jgi:hypothetical protein
MMVEIRAVTGWDHTFLLLIHILLVVAWLGMDIGTFTSSNFSRNPKYTIEQRFMMWKVGSILDMGPRTGILAMYPIGAWLSWSGGWGFKENIGSLSPLTQLTLISIIFGCWLMTSWWQFWGHRQVVNDKAGPRLEHYLKLYLKWDTRTRWVLCFLLLLDGLMGLMGYGFISQKWLAWKVLLFGVIVLHGLGIRWSWAGESWAGLIKDMLKNKPTPEKEAKLNRALLKMYPFILMIYLLIIVISVFGIAKIPK